MSARDLETRSPPSTAIPSGKDRTMAVLAVIIPVLMLGVVLALGRYEEWLLPNEDWPLPVPPAPARSPGATDGATLSH
ncbi:hypothetical protein GCM10018775_06970 [Streptomyces umbrinus]|nr:hypothetical protein GCM10018775_06970 [Streptomyces umbrinus]